MRQSCLPWILYRSNGNILSGISPKRYARVSELVQKPWVQPIRRLLLAKGWTQGELADKAGMRPNTLSEAMNGRSPRMDTLEQIAAAFDVPLFELFVSEEQSTLLRQASQNQRQLVQQEDLATKVIQQLGPIVAQLVAAATGSPAPQQTTTHNPATPQAPPAAEHPARGRLQHKKQKSA
jgi:transcriptional regulator with XRE-family HTH domain